MAAEPVKLSELNWSPLPRLAQGERSWWLGVVSRLLREPALLLSTAYLLVGFLGLWSSYWFFAGFDVPILSYLQASDYLVAGLRHPLYLGLLAAGVLLALLVSWPETVASRHPRQVEALRRSHWGWRCVFVRMPLMRWQGLGLHPFTGMSMVVAGVLLVGSALAMQQRAVQLRSGAQQHPVRVHLAGDAAPLPGHAELLGTSSGFVYLWWPARQQAEVVPTGAVRRLLLVPPSGTGTAGPGPAAPASPQPLQ